MNSLAIRGHVTIQVEDKHGMVKQRVCADNALSPAALTAMLYNGLTKFSTSAQTALGFGGGIAASQVVNAMGNPMFGMYALKETFDWSKESQHWIKPPYAGNNYASLSEAVLYYHVGNNAAEDPSMMVRSIQRSYFNPTGKFRAEFVKSVGLAGTIKSVALGTAHSALMSNLWGTTWNEPVPSSFFTTALVSGTSTTSGVAFEHQTDRTIAHCRGTTSAGVTTAYTYDFKTQETISNMATTELTHGYLVHTRADGTRMASAVGNSGTPSDSAHDIELSTSINWNTPMTRVLTPQNIAAGSLDTNRRALPVLVMRPDTQEIEIFLSLNYDGGGCRLVKGVIDADDPQDGAVTWTEMGKIPFVMGQINAANRLLGYYDAETSTYWLPYTGVINSEGLFTPCTSAVTGTGVNQNANFIPGIKLQSSGGKFNSGTYYADVLAGFYIARTIFEQGANTAAYTSPLDIIKSSFGIHQGTFRDATAANRAYRDYGVVFSAVNLPTPVYRETEDVLRLVYTYQLGNA